ncbi:protein Vhl [Drosophila madeirensis]|uniref:Blast:Protein Vhl n=2 Tax=obscura subgroup TaxID=32357 RepID=A0A3B0J4T9_DROGU|nr:protein Vhl [Drosophila guanche]XP_034651740.1 protein Vhl [Drosophila subobscura]SPP74593.1 blast:Protein Vhl [Drosophila guanche]
MALQIAHNNRGNPRALHPPPAAELVEVFVLFVNTTNRTVDLYWVCDRDTENMYLSLKPFEEVRVNTYNTHTWLFRDYYTGERMHVKSRRIFVPVPMRVPKNPQHPEELCDVRSQVNIHFPMRKLKDTCLWLLARYLNRTSNQPRRLISNYMIPSTLKQQLFVILTTMESYSRTARIRRRRVREMINNI